MTRFFFFFGTICFSGCVMCRTEMVRSPNLKFTHVELMHGKIQSSKIKQEKENRLVLLATNKNEWSH